ncbi:Wound-induced protein Wun1-like [Sesbania bispinosa]|nr:Wound-induced protein Wun1-like [Sesbania bispinosa]
MSPDFACLVEEEEEDRNKRAITGLYKALISKDTDTIHRLLAPDLEWWFHGPPCHRHHLIPFLTGSFPSSSSPTPNPLVPDLIVGFGSVIIAEGYDETNLVWWVHAWTTVDGIITEVREYVNTSVTVTRLGNYGFHVPKSKTVPSSETVSPASTCQCIWQSKLSDGSVPGLILAI